MWGKADRMTDERHRARLRRSWDDAAELYDEYFVPRFAPWVAEAVAPLTEVDLPSGPILVPCCGTFPEHRALADAYPDRPIVGIDLSEGMIGLARERIGTLRNIEALVRDATELDEVWANRCAAVVSVFGLQQLPDPLVALGDWTRTLRPGGVMSVVYWPPYTEANGPFALLEQLAEDDPEEGEADLTRDQISAVVEEEGGDLILDVYRSFPISHPDAETFWDAMLHGGPLRSRATARGDSWTADIRRRFLAAAPSGEWMHNPRARHLVARR